VKIQNAIIGPHVSIGNGTTVVDSVVRNSIIQESSKIVSQCIAGSMIGNHVVLEGEMSDLNIGDYTNTIH
jgi:glucose-1-phosphate thymidylyltransferase